MKKQYDLEIPIAGKEQTQREVYNFYYENQWYVWLNYYALETRLTPRHKWQIVKYYDLLHYKIYDNKMEEKDVPLTENVINMLKNKIITKMKIQKWSASGRQ